MDPLLEKKKSIWLRKINLFSGKIQVVPFDFCSAFPLMILSPHLYFISKSLSYLMGLKGPNIFKHSSKEFLYQVVTQVNCEKEEKDMVLLVGAKKENLFKIHSNLSLLSQSPISLFKFQPQLVLLWFLFPKTALDIGRREEKSWRMKKKTLSKSS